MTPFTSNCVFEGI